MDRDQVLRHARDPRAKNNIFNALWDEYQKVSAHLEERRIFSPIIKTLAANMQLIKEDIQKIRNGEDVADSCLEKIYICRTTMENLLAL